MFYMGKIIGLKVTTIRTFRNDQRKKKYLHPMYILFSDKKTVIELDEQDYYSYHDCSSCARTINIREDEQNWKRIFDDLEHYPESNTDI